jgi:LCP family protein required for cell wall assembly
MTDATAPRPRRDHVPSRGSGGPSRGAPSGREALRRQIRAGFRRSIGLTAIGTLIPGAGLTQTRSKKLGWAILVLFLGAGAAAVYTALSQGITNTVLSLVARPSLLQGAAAGLVVVGVLWCASIILTAIQTRPSRLDRTRTRTLAALTTILVFLVAGSTYKVAEYAMITTSTVQQVFNAGAPVAAGQGAAVVEGEDPWAETPRVNILMMGSDAGVGRTGTRTDSMMVASIDTKTGRTALISLPRNLEKAPLPKDSPLRGLYPSGIYGSPVCFRQQVDQADPCALNAIWTETDQYRESHPNAFAGAGLGAVPGRDETRDVISEVLGLKIDQTVVIDLKGFAQLINAMGGLDINVKPSGYGTPLPIGGSRDANGNLKPGSVKGYFTPGRQHLSGWQSLWYARSRAADSDTYRQARQRCVVQAIVQQVNPAAMVSKYPELAKIAKDNIYTDVPAQNLPAFVELIERVQKAKMTSVSLTKITDYSSVHPDYAAIHALVKKAIAAPKPAATPSTTPSTPKPSSTRTSRPATPSPTTTPYEQC